MAAVVVTARLQAGHTRSLNSTIVTRAVDAPRVGALRSASGVGACCRICWRTWVRNSVMPPRISRVISSVVPHMGLGHTAFAISKGVATFVPLLLSAWGAWHGVRAFILAKRGIPCYKESDFAAFLGLVISVVVAGMFLYFGILSPSVASRP